MSCVICVRYCEQQEIEGKDKSIIIDQIIRRNICIDNIVKFQLPQTWNSVKGQPNERVLSFLASIVNTHISIFIMQVEINAWFSHNCGKSLRA